MYRKRTCYAQFRRALAPALLLIVVSWGLNSEAEISQNDGSTVRTDVSRLQQSRVIDLIGSGQGSPRDAYGPAIDGIRRIGDRYSELAHSALKGKDDRNAERYVKQGLRVVPKHEGLVAVRAKPNERRRQEKKRKERIQRFIEDAEYLAQNRGCSESETVAGLYRMVLRLDPDNN